MNSLRLALQSLRSVIFPQECHACGRVLGAQERQLCIDCLSHLPRTQYLDMPGNPVEQLFMGRIPVSEAAAFMHFRADTISQVIVHQIKYHDDIRLARLMGAMIGHGLMLCRRFDDCEVLLPVPLHSKKLRQRGYNQSEEICKGIATIFDRPIDTRSVRRTRHTLSQTRRTRIERLDNMAGVFTAVNPKALEGRHVLVVDDVITTGATTEACCQAILKVPGTKVSILSLASAL